MTKTRGRLDGKVGLVTGAAGEIGQSIVKAFLQEGAKVIMTGRTESKLSWACNAIVADRPDWAEKLFFVSMDNSCEESLAKAIPKIPSQFLPIDILVNNAGTAGPQEQLVNLPFDASDGFNETVEDAVGSLLMGPWLTTIALLPQLRDNASIVNVSTIFSKCPYFGRVPYVVPKATLNILGKILSKELGGGTRKIRVNTIYPGPVETERILRVFGVMDKLRSAPNNTTRNEMLERMTIKSSSTGNIFIPREDVANTVVFLGSGESGSLTSHDFEISRGFKTSDDAASTLTSRPQIPTAALQNCVVWIVGGDNADDICEIVGQMRRSGACVLISVSTIATFNELKQREIENNKTIISKWDPRSSSDWNDLKGLLNTLKPDLWSVVVLPAVSNAFVSATRTKASDIKEFVSKEITNSISIAKHLEKYFIEIDQQLQTEPTIVFLSNADDGKGNVGGQMKRAAVRQLIRTWNQEFEVAIKNGKRTRGARLHQLIRYENLKPGNLGVCVDWIIALTQDRLIFGTIDISLHPELEANQEEYRGSSAIASKMNLENLHQDRVALVTGGSEGIGGAITQCLMKTGARVAVAERSGAKLELMKERFLAGIAEKNYPNPEGRVLAIPDCDVSMPDTLNQVIEKTIAKFGRIDFVINNAGLVGAEDMAVDISTEMWSKTIVGNLVSNYQLTLAAIPYMINQKFGNVLNMSSYFGGDRHGVVPYTNRSDYAVSKSGQIALAEAIADVLGPHIRINAIAPGPVDGARLNGTIGRPGLYQRRARLLMDNKRLNQIYSATVSALKMGHSVSGVLKVLTENKLERESLKSSGLNDLINLSKTYSTEQKQDVSASKYFLQGPQFKKLIVRLQRAGWISSTAEYLEKFVEPPEPFHGKDIVEKYAIEIRNNMLSRFAIGRMPTDVELAREVVSSLGHLTLTGEVSYPTGGFKYEGYNLTECFGVNPTESFSKTNAGSQSLSENCNGETVFIFAGSMLEEVSDLAIKLSEKCRVFLFSPSEAFCKQFNINVNVAGQKRGDSVTIQSSSSDSIDAIFDSAIAKFGAPNVVVSFPMADLPENSTIFLGEKFQLPSLKEFSQLIVSNISNHFLVFRRASLFNNCSNVLVTHPFNARSSKQWRSWAKFVHRTVKSFTLAAGKEADHLGTGARFYQVGGDLTNAELRGVILDMAFKGSKSVAFKKRNAS